MIQTHRQTSMFGQHIVEVPQAFWTDAVPITISPDNAELDMVLNATIN